ncbi:hypothetical protein C8J57DRAFT_194338 [Mycena rebaudengoi]|nr:hypothetical protein C8J57DRAFT_194338 [Mycena rebaudengoi]
MNSSTTAFSPGAPAELWRLVFRMATTSTTSYAVHYYPFQPLRELEETSAYMELESLRIKTCLAIMRVCRLFRLIAAEFLYEDVRIYDKEGLQSLCDGLERSWREHGSYGFGRHVRRLELPARPTTFKNSPHLTPFPMPPISSPADAIRFVDIIRLCPRLEILAKPCLRLDTVELYFWSSLISAPIENSQPLLPHLKRLEWFETDLDTRFFGTKSTARLTELISHSPNLQYLYLSSDRPDALTRLPPCSSLHTLRINRSQFHAHHVKNVRTPCIPLVPNLTHLVLHTTLPSSMLSFVAAVGRQLRVLEFSFSPQLVFSSNQMQRLLSRCDALEELVYYLGAPEISPLLTFQHTSLRRVRLKIDPDEWYPYRNVIRNQFDILDGPSFPGLKHVVLDDRKRSLLRRDSGQSLLLRLAGRGCTVVYEDGSLALSG